MGKPEVECDVSDGATIADLLERLKQDHPQLNTIIPRCALSVNGEYATNRTRAICEADEIALLPPMSGG